MESEVHKTLIEMCEPVQKKADFSQLQTLVEHMYGDKKPTHVVDDLIAERRAEAGRE